MENMQNTPVEVIFSLITILLGMSLFSSFFNSIHAEAKTWMWNYVHKYNRRETKYLKARGQTPKHIKMVLQKTNHRQWDMFNKYYAFVKTITFLILFALICLTLFGYCKWGVDIKKYPEYWLSLYVFGILGSLLLQLFGMFFALFDFFSRTLAALGKAYSKVYNKVKTTILELWKD